MLIGIGALAHADEQLRLLNHWDNLDGTVERGFAGRSIFWSQPHTSHPLTVEGAASCPVCQHIVDYGRRNQEIEINGTVLNNVNASAKILTDHYIDTVCLYADLLRPFGIKVYLSVNFASPMLIDVTGTADPLNDKVQHWWKRKFESVYKKIPDFGGILVKANSEGQPGPLDYKRSHADGANMLARALKAHGGVCIWRAFVYSQNDPDRAKQALIEFQDLDGKFDDNVIIQIKNGPIDFQPREPISPLFYHMPRTKVMGELQITQEYLGHSNHIAYLGTMWHEFFYNLKRSQQRDKTIINYVGTAGVANIGDCQGSYREGRIGSWCGNLMAEVNWYAFGRMAKQPDQRPMTIAQEWIDKNFPESDSQTRTYITMILMMSREAVVDYMTPLGLHHIMGWGHHYGPEPWCAIPGARPDWMPSYYHRADEKGLGADRTAATGTGATPQYPKSIATRFEALDECPEEYLLWFHHADWNYRRSWTCADRYIAYTPARPTEPIQETLWEHLCRHYQNGVETVAFMKMLWDNCRNNVPYNVYTDIVNHLETQYRDAQWWRDACLLYFQEFSKQPLPAFVDAPKHDLNFYKSIQLGIDNYTNPSPELLDSKR